MSNYWFFACFLFLFACNQGQPSEKFQGVYVDVPIPHLVAEDSSFMLLDHAGQLHQKTFQLGEQIEVYGVKGTDALFSYIIADSLISTGKKTAFRSKTVQHGALEFEGVIQSIAQVLEKKTAQEDIANDKTALIYNNNKLKYLLLKGKRGKDISKIIEISPKKQQVKGMYLNQNGWDVLYLDSPHIQAPVNKKSPSQQLQEQKK